MDFHSALVKFTNKAGVVLVDDVEADDHFLSTGPVDINIYADGSAEISIFSMAIEKDILYNKYFSKVDERASKEVIDLLSKMLNNEVFEFRDSVEGPIVAIKHADTFLSLNTGKIINSDFSMVSLIKIKG